MKLLRWLGYGVAVLAGIAVVAALIVYVLSQRALADAPGPRPSHLAKPTPAQLADASRQLDVLGCRDCHGAKLEGKNFFNDPMLANLYAPNLTLVAAKATDAQLDQAIRQGIGRDGRPLFVMPSQQYQFLTDAETAALIAAIRATPKAGSETPPVKLGPIGRIGLATGKFVNGPKLVAQYRGSPVPDLGPQFARGRHLVQTACSECHGANLKGREVEPGVVSADLAIAGAYDLDQFKALMRTGAPPSHRDLKLMDDVAKVTFSHYNDDEIAAIHAYLAERAKRQP
ncbi:MAG: c-type cytochrome [Pseudomonadota bacterium]